MNENCPPNKHVSQVQVWTPQNYSEHTHSTIPIGGMRVFSLQLAKSSRNTQEWRIKKKPSVFSVFSVWVSGQILEPPPLLFAPLQGSFPSPELCLSPAGFQKGQGPGSGHVRGSPVLSLQS